LRDIPVILVCYNRPWHTAQVLKALLEHNVQNLYIFSDAPKNSRDVEGVLKTRELFKAVRWTKPKIIERDENYGLARNIVSAVNHVFERHDRLILLEDDCVPRRYFFDFMKECLERYENHDRVFGINGYTAPIAEDLLSDYPFDIYFYPRIGSWGWATWNRAWMHYEPDLRKIYEQVKAGDIDINQGGTDIPQNVQKLINGEIKDVWTLNWVLSVYLNKGYYIYPTFSQIRNIGFDGTGLHCGETHKFDNFCVDYKPRRFPDDIVINEGLINNYNDYFGNPNKEPEVVSRPTIQHNFIAEPRCTKHNCGTVNTGKLSIVHVNTHDRAGGAAKVAWRLAEAQRNAGCDSIMLVGEKRSDSKYSFAFPVEADRSLRIQCRQQGQLYYEFQGSHRLVDNPFVLSADILHLHNLHGDFFNPFSLSFLSHLKPTVWTLHDQQPTTGHCAYSLDCQRWENGCGRCPMLSLYPDILVDASAQLYRDKKLIYDNSYLNIVVPSQWLKDKVQRSILRNHPVELIYNGIDTNIFRPYDKIEARKKFGISVDVLVIGAVAHGGTLGNPWKGGNYARAVFDALQTKLQGHVFVNIGGNSQSNDSRIVDIPNINDESELAQAYSMLDIFLYTPAADNCPLVVLEALSCGIPIVTFDTGGVPELVRDGLDGYVSPYKDVYGLVQALEKLATQTQLRAEFSRNARQEAIARFDHKKTAQQYQKLYERCLQQRKSKTIKAKLLPLESVPKVILSDAFIKAENAKKALTCDVEKKRETKCRDSFKVSRDNELVIAASIALNHHPKISIVTPSFNQGQFLEECIDSILSQNYPNLEYIIMDGGSTDGSVEIIKKYEKYLTYWQSKPDGGQYAAIDQGFKRTSGEIMAWLNSDDKYHPNSLFNVVHIFGKYPDVEWITGRPTSWNEDGQLINIGWLPSWCRENFIQPGPKEYYIQQESTFWKRTLWGKAGAKLRTDLKFAGDLELWIRFFRHAQLYTVDALLGGFRHHPNQKTKLCMDKYNREAELLINQEITYIKKTGSAYMPPAPEPISNRENFKLTIATSIAPKNLKKQAKAIESWMKLGFDVVSLNCAEEIEILKRPFPNVNFVRTERDGRDLFGKTVVYFDDFLEYFRENNCELCSIVNSDIFLIGDEGIISFIKEQAADSVVYGPRVNIDSLEQLDGEFFNEGFDFFFFPKTLISCFPKSRFCIGLPWWDYWMLLIPILEGIPVKKLVSPFAYHIKHSFKWDRKQGKLLINKCFEYLQPKLRDNFNANPDTNQSAFLARMLQAYHDRDVRENNRAEKDKISPDVFYHCIFDFLKIKSSEISYAGSESIMLQNTQSKKQDIFIRKGISKAQNADYLHADYDVSIVLCTKDRAELLDRMLASLKKAAKCVAYEVIVVEGGSTDNTLEVLRKHRIAKVYSEAEWLGRGRHSWPQLYNFGFSKATGRWAMYASDDIIFSEESISWAFRALSSQKDKVAGGIFFYKNVYSLELDWESYGIDFTHGQKLLMNYGLVRLDYFREVGGLEDVYRFYCADTDFCYKLYERGLQLIPLPECFVAHNNVLDAQKTKSLFVADGDTQLLLKRWKHFVSTETPNPRRLLWQEDLLEVFNLPADLERVDTGIESFWHGLAYFQRGFFQEAKEKFQQAVQSHCNHWQVLWYLAKAAYQCGDKALAEQTAKGVLKLAPNLSQAKDLLNQLCGKAEQDVMLLTGQIENKNQLLAPTTSSKKSIVGLIFSKDRAMQLRAALESFFLHCADSERIKLFVLYQVSNQLHQRQYNNLKKDFANITFIKETNFKQQLFAIVEGFEYVLFLVDDNLFVKDFCLADVIKSLRENNDAIGFSLRLGKNTNYCYSHDSKQSLPVFQRIDNEILKHNWTASEYDFGYPLELSSSLYRTSDILILLDKLEFANPNVLEDMMAANAQLYAQTKDCLLCYENSVAFCNPVNKVQSVWNNRSGSNYRYSADRLAQMFEEGVKIDVEKFSGFVPNSCHQEVHIYFKGNDRSSEKRATGIVQADNSYEQQFLQSTPKFSIVMANYNNEKYIAEAIESVLNQTFTDWELIIVEDCSADNSPNIIKKYLNDMRIKLIQHEKNRGYTAALKTGIANVRSEYFGIFDSDDCLQPHAVETMHAYHVKFPNCGLIYSQFAYCHQDLIKRCVGFCDKIPTDKTALDVNVVSHFKTFKLHDYLKTSGYDENILYAEDVDIVYKMEEVTSLKFVDKCLYLYRELPTSICHSKNKINVAIMSRVKARINALKRRCAVLAKSGNKNFEDLFTQAIKQARTTHKDVEQYFVILAKLYENQLLPDLNLPVDVKSRDAEYRLLWLAANVNIKFDELFELLAGQGQAEKQPLVTVYMVTYNAQKFISQAIDSVLSQVYKNFELLIVDDGSTDKTKELVVSYSDDRIRYIHKEHKNFASGMNRAIAEAKGKYFMGVDSDDFIAPDYIEKMVAFAEKHPQIDYFYPAQFTLVNESGGPTGQHWNYIDFSDNSVLPAFLFDNAYGPIPNPGSLKRKTLFDKVGLYDEVDTVEDFVFLCKNVLKINFKRVDEHSTYFYRRHRQSNSQKLKARNRVMADVLNEMVLIYPAEALYPQIADISDADLKEQQYYKYVVETFCRHANGPMVQFGHYFQKYAEHYRSKFLRITEQKQLVPK